eukprot:COSAG05_NODE_436_length_9838_cov_49.389876_2_plen_83_part_00
MAKKLQHQKIGLCDYLRTERTAHPYWFAAVNLIRISIAIALLLRCSAGRMDRERAELARLRADMGRMQEQLAQAVEAWKMKR